MWWPHSDGALLHASEEPEADLAKVGHAAPAIDAFYPLTMPLTVGPGSISVAVTLGSQRPTPSADMTELAILGGAAVAGLAAIAVTIFVSYRFADRIILFLGPRGTDVLMRLSAFILFCIGIQIIWNGLSVLISKGGMRRPVRPQAPIHLAYLCIAAARNPPPAHDFCKGFQLSMSSIGRSAD